jgi:hypothetical protein
LAADKPLPEAPEHLCVFGPIVLVIAQFGGFAWPTWLHKRKQKESQAHLSTALGRTLATISKYQTSSGATLYRVRYRTPGRGQTDKRGFKTKRDAEAFANTVEVTKARGEYVAPSLGRVTVGELGLARLARKKAI